jgi:uncharacterized protein YjcR
LGDAYNKLERIRALLLANVDYIPSTKEIKQLKERRDKLPRLHDQEVINKKIREKQFRRIDEMKTYNQLLNLWGETREKIKKKGAVRNLPQNTTVKDFEDIDQTETGLMAQIKGKFASTPWSSHKRSSSETGGGGGGTEEEPKPPQPNFEDGGKEEDA